jgi:DNA-binding HxlR family transcriptional regulator
VGKNGTSHIERDRCPLYTAICVIQGRWKPMIFRRLGEGSLGLGELRRTMPGVTAKVLRQQLRELEADCLVTRSVQKKPALQVKYQISPHGQTLGPVFELWTWGTLHLAHVEDAAISSREQGFRQIPPEKSPNVYQFTSVTVISECGATM